MKKLTAYIAIAAILTGCSSTTPLSTRLTPLGEEPENAKEKFIYGLPQTILKVEITYRESMNIPGPYGDYAEKFLGISEVIKQKATRWQIEDVAVESFSELDPDHYYSLNVLEGELNWQTLYRYQEEGMILNGTKNVHEIIKEEGRLSVQDPYHLRYEDMGVYNNFEERSETMYKTLVNDTSYVQVPVQRTVVEQKSPSTKAREAADFLLEIRLRRFEMLTGEYEVYPNGEAMAAALQKLDEMEASYLSLFTGKTVSRLKKKSWFVVPENGPEPSRYPLEMFSEQLGFVPADLLEGLPLEIRITPLGKTSRPAGYLSKTGGDKTLNNLYYRVPDIAQLRVMLGPEVLSEHRISIFQSGAIITVPVN